MASDAAIEGQIEADLLAQLRARPYDHHVRLVYADWLEERGDHDRAMVLRIDAGTIAPRYDTHRVRERVERGWLEAVDPRAARRDPTWLAAVLGGEPERAQLGELAPQLLSAPRAAAEGALAGWPARMLARLAATAARLALEATALRPDLDPQAPRCHAILERIERAIATPPLVPITVSFREAATEIGMPPYARPHARARAQARWHAHTATAWAARTLGAYARADAYDQGTPAAAALALSHAGGALAELAWSQGGAKRRHAAARSLAQQAHAAQVRSDYWDDLERRGVARTVYEGRDGAARRAELATTAQRARDIAAEASAAAERARGACPPAPPTEAIVRELIDAVAADTLRWLRTQSEW